MNIPQSTLKPFGYTGIPTLTLITSDPVILFGDRFLRILKEALMDCARHSSLPELADNIHESMRLAILLGGMTHRSRKYGVSNVRITVTPEYQVYLDWDTISIPRYQLMIAQI